MKFEIVSDLVQWKKPEARRVVVVMSDPPTTPDGWQTAGRALAADLVHQSALLLIFVYPDRASIHFNGWIARIIARAGSVMVYTDNDPDTKHALIESIRED